MKVKDIEPNDIKFQDIIRRLELSKEDGISYSGPSQGIISPTTSTLTIHAGSNTIEPILTLPDDWETVVRLLELLLAGRRNERPSIPEVRADS